MVTQTYRQVTSQEAFGKPEGVNTNLCEDL